MVTLPLLLAGPILRRVEPRLVSVWAALTQPANLRVNVWFGLQDAGGIDGALASVATTALMSSAPIPTRRLGNRLHVGVAVAELPSSAQPLQPGALHSYNLTITPSGAAAADLRSLGLLADGPGDMRALGYQPGLLPSFATAPVSLDDLVLLHASCQKPHGGGPSMVAHLDELIAQARNDPLARPHRLFLTGDQIYADDVATALLPALNALGATLLGVDERLPGPSGVGGDHDATIANFPAARRHRLVAIAGLTSTDAANHLLAFGEYAAMYLATLSPAPWEEITLAVAERFGDPPLTDQLARRIAEDADAGPANAPVVLRNVGSGPLESALTPLFGTGAGAAEAKRLAEAREEFLGHKGALKELRRDVWHARRALANVPTYMLADDHDVTDDWFVRGAWRDQVLGDRLGRALIRNGMAAFIAFQGWGNDPKAWNEGVRLQLLDAIAGLFPANASDGPATGASAQIDQILGLAPGQAPQVDLSFQLDGPAHRVVGLDTRTRRAYPHPESPPELLTRQALQDQLPGGPLPAGLEVLVVLSAAPVLSAPFIHEIGLPLGLKILDIVGAYRRREENRQRAAQDGSRPRPSPANELIDLDQEGWSAAPFAFERLLARLAGSRRVVVLSGDIHYGAAYTLDYLRPGSGARSRIVQFTSSAIRNAWPYSIPSVVAHHGWAQVMQAVGLPARRLGWDEAEPSVLADAPTGERLSIRGRLRQSPVLLPFDGWRHQHTLARPPDWYWEANQILDPRPAALRPPETRPPTFSEPDIPPFPPPGTVVDLLRTAGTLGYSQLAQAHQRGLRTLRFIRGLNFSNNVGRVTFARQEGGGWEVTQELFSLSDEPEPNERPAAHTVHTASLTPEAIVAPTAVGGV